MTGREREGGANAPPSFSIFCPTDMWALHFIFLYFVSCATSPPRRMRTKSNQSAETTGWRHVNRNHHLNRLGTLMHQFWQLWDSLYLVFWFRDENQTRCQIKGLKMNLVPAIAVL